MMKKTILVIDDEPAIRLLLNEVLKKDYAIITANDGLDAISWLSEGNKVDLIITDISMPNIDGIDLIKNLRFSTKMRDIPIIVLSANVDEDSQNKAYQNGVFEFFPKPFDPNKLKIAVKDALESIDIF
jgi:two-component system chemotaxis response regulator CheY